MGAVEEGLGVHTLLELLRVFVEGHLERCLGAASSGMLANIQAFLRELTSLSCASANPEYLAKVINGGAAFIISS